MSGAFKPCLHMLPPAQQRLWPELGRTAELGFALYGGTAIALHLGHRFSVDFDFFSEKPLDRDAIQAAFRFMPQSTVLQDERNTVSVLVGYAELWNDGEGYRLRAAVRDKSALMRAIRAVAA
jgi:hypothetical protein